jgi:hypothetical protein
MHCRDREAFAQAFLVFAQASQLAIPPGSAEFYWLFGKFCGNDSGEMGR